MVRLFCDMKASRGMLLVALALLAIAALRDFARLGERCRGVRLTTSPTSIVPGAALDRGADPYRYEPLHRCEHAVNVERSLSRRSTPGRSGTASAVRLSAFHARRDD